MSTHTFQAQGRRSTVALPERTEAHRECRPGAKSKHISPYARGTKVIGKADGEAHQHPGTSMFQKGLPQNLRVPSEPVPQTLGFSILDPGYREYVTMRPRGPAPGRHISLITAMQIQDQEFLLPSRATDHLQQISTNTSDLHWPNLRVLPSIDMQAQDPESP
ncbi:hypothetical protein DY000_02049167 [Brassica cretica]|uniref:Uncharacterized protein n=1 Tax=Brassica cretica TaxID=69181 RepID=A0ABQ7EZ86_BRACR|nr:hypothetical protein DY000_02049167 [Brassica cretica]